MNASRLSPANVAPRSTDGPAPLLTIFAIPKPFANHVGVIQTNALASWAALRPAVEIVLFGAEPGVAEAATDFGARHICQIARNERGTPLVSDAFAQMARFGQTPYLAYCNADLILLPDFGAAVERLARADLRSFLAIGRRVDVDLRDRIDFSRQTQVDWIASRASKSRRASIMCKDYFVYPRGQFAELPRFAVGRGNWDSWMVRTAKDRKIPVVDLTPCTTVVHQNHTHAHVSGGRGATYVSGPEARQNQAAAGGTYWIRGATANWELTSSTLRRKSWARCHLAFWGDLPNAGRLVWSLLRDRSRGS